MANTTSARKAARKIARRTEINKARRSRMRSAGTAFFIASCALAQEAMKKAEPALMRAAQQGQVHSNTASRKVSRLTHQIAKLAK